MIKALHQSHAHTALCCHMGQISSLLTEHLTKYTTHPLTYRCRMCVSVRGHVTFVGGERRGGRKRGGGEMMSWQPS